MSAGLAAVAFAAGAGPAAASPTAARPGHHRTSQAAAAAAAKKEAEELEAWAAAVAAAKADVIEHESLFASHQPAGAAPGGTSAASPVHPAATGSLSAPAEATAGLALFAVGGVAGAGVVALLRRRRMYAQQVQEMAPGGPPDWLTVPAGEAGPEPPGEVAVAPPSELLIGILGTFTINGAPAALKPAQGQLLLSLALNGDEGLSSAMMCDLLGPGPDHPKPADSLRQLIGRTRRQLGTPGDGREWIEHRGSGWYALHPDTRFDWAEFDDLAERGLGESDRALLSSAMVLVRGEPFRDCDWWWVDQAFLQSVRARIAETALCLARLELAAGDAPAAARAARTGLGIDPADERLWRALMRAEHGAGRPGGVQDAWNACLAVLADIALDGQPHPDTAALHRELADCPSAEGIHMHQERNVA